MKNIEFYCAALFAMCMFFWFVASFKYGYEKSLAFCTPLAIAVCGILLTQLFTDPNSFVWKIIMPILTVGYIGSVFAVFLKLEREAKAKKQSDTQLLISMRAEMQHLLDLAWNSEKDETGRALRTRFPDGKPTLTEFVISDLTIPDDASQ